MAHVVLIDGHAVFRQALALLVDRLLGLPITAQAGSLVEGRRALPEGALVVVDVALPDGSGVDLVRHLQQTPSVRRILALAPPADPEALAAAMNAGADQALSTEVGLDELMGTLAQLAAEVRDG